MWDELVDWAKRNMIEGPELLASADDIAIPTPVATIDEAMALLEPRIVAFRQASE